MFRQPAKKKPSGRTYSRITGVPLAPLKMDHAVDVIFATKPEDVKKIIASKPGKKK
jgi:hypothetical protein